ncbi:hypothetical protein RRG08_016584 [Elysia crispata]|uniref:Uncharacterized protein n=1 Tax=Elysia crispata TaxID=231223 RepID=A0AAE0YAH1_9GAST|nr:hypothetical protein RRG08_016584 [Elysia crispata]
MDGYQGKRCDTFGRHVNGILNLKTIAAVCSIIAIACLLICSLTVSPEDYPNEEKREASPGLKSTKGESLDQEISKLYMMTESTFQKSENVDIHSDDMTNRSFSSQVDEISQLSFSDTSSEVDY